MLRNGSTVLVTGGTGFTGSVLVRKLVSLGCCVRVIARESANRSSVDDLNVEWIVGDVFNAAIVERACEGVAYVFHLAAAYRVAGVPDETYHNVHIKSTQLLAKYSNTGGNLKRFVHVSTVGVHGHIDNPPANEDSPFQPGDIYQRTKAEAETWISEYAIANNFPLTVVRPAAIFGAGDMRLLKLFKLAKLSVVPIIGYSRGLYHLIHVDDLVEFMICAAESDESVDQIYICGNARSTSIREIITIVAKHLHRNPKFVRFPAWPIFWLAYACEAVCKLIRVEPPIYPRRVAFFTKDRSFDTSKMTAVSNFQYAHTNKSGIEATCNWYIEKNLL